MVFNELLHAAEEEFNLALKASQEHRYQDASRHIESAHILFAKMRWSIFNFFHRVKDV